MRIFLIKIKSNQLFHGKMKILLLFCSIIHFALEKHYNVQQTRMCFWSEPLQSPHVSVQDWQTDNNNIYIYKDWNISPVSQKSYTN